MMVALFLFLKGMTGALAPFSYLVQKYKEKRFCNFTLVFKVIRLISSSPTKGQE